MVAIYQFDHTFRGKPATTVVHVAKVDQYTVKDCQVDVQVQIQRINGGKSFASIPRVQQDRDKRQPTRKRLRVKINGTYYTLARLCAFAFGNVLNLTWEQFNTKGKYKLGSAECTGYLYQADHLEEPDGRKHPSNILSDYLRVCEVVSNWLQG